MRIHQRLCFIFSGIFVISTIAILWSRTNFFWREESRKSFPSCMKKHQILFIKVHKAGSSTVTTILQRFALVNNLSVALPNKTLHTDRYNYFGQPTDSLKQEHILPPLSGHERNSQYDILCNHVVYNQSAFERIFPQRMFRLAIVRDPLQQFISTFRYYGMTKQSYFEGIFNKTTYTRNPVSVYLLSPMKFEPPDARWSFTNNRQIIDLGLAPSLLRVEGKVIDYVDFIKQHFDLIMVMEYFDESLVLLKRKLCWSFKDILYMPKNKNWNTMNLNLTVSDLDLLKKWMFADFILYERSLNKFWYQVEQEGSDFHGEVFFFKTLQIRIRVFCGEKFYTNPMVVSKSRWGHEFIVTADDCELLHRSETQLLDTLYHDLYNIVKTSNTTS